MKKALEPNSIAELKAKLRGRVIEPDDPDYDDARKVYNAMIDKRPRLIARCADVADVISSVGFARKHDLLLAVRSGGHNGGGLGICDDGLVIDLGPIKYTRVDPAGRTVIVGGGCTWGDVDHATHAFGLATPSGIISTTGVGGLTLGGGIGHLTRKCGLTIDNLVSADLVLADGSFVKANADENPDLFWAIRGGGGNFGIVTSFTFKLHPIDTIYGGPMLYELSETAEVMKWYRDLIKRAPEDLNGWFAFLTVPPAAPFPEHLHLKKMCGVIWTWTGSLPQGEETFKPIRAFKKAALDTSKTIDIIDFVREDEIDPRFFETPYYLVPSKGGDKPYALLREAMRQSNVVGVGKVIIRRTQHLAGVRVVGQALVIELMRFANELVDIGEYSFPGSDAIREQELTMATQLVQNLAEHLALWPLASLVDRVHPARNDLPRLAGSRAAFWQETWRHLLFGFVLGELERRLNAPEPEAPSYEDVFSSNGHGSLEQAVPTVS